MPQAVNTQALCGAALNSMLWLVLAGLGVDFLFVATMMLEGHRQREARHSSKTDRRATCCHAPI